jgi:hypothetical protein
MGTPFDSPPGTTILLPKRPPKTTEDKEETIQKLEVRNKCTQRTAGPRIHSPFGGPHMYLKFSFLLAQHEFLFLFIFT